MSVGETPSIVTRSDSTSFQRRSCGQSGAPSAYTTAAPAAPQPTTVHGPMIQPMSVAKWTRSPALMSDWYAASRAIETRKPPCTCSAPFGRPVHGEVGELVCKRPWPGMTRGVWRDPERYLDTYWRRFPGVWTHGDWASIDEDGYWFLHGRSDDTLNIAGKRIGPAELESAAIGSGRVAEAAAIGVPHELKGEAAWLFCVLDPSQEPRSELAREVAHSVVAALGKAFRPERVVFVDQLPKTRSAKIMRRVIRATYLGKEPGDLSSLENPASLDEIQSVR